MTQLRMNLQFFAQEKTEKATPKKRADARKKGQVAKSNDIPGSLIMFFSFLMFFMLGGFYKERLYQLFTYVFHDMVIEELTVDHVIGLLNHFMLEILIVLSPVMLVAVLLGFFGNYVQFGLLFTAEPLKMKIEKINPLAGFKRIFSMRSLIEFLKSMLKILIIATIVYMILWREKDEILGMALLSVGQMFTYVSHLTLTLGLTIAAALLILAIGDYYYQKYDHEKNLRMSKQDIKDEHKKSEGDPLIKSKIRERQRRMAMQRMMQEIPKADVVITNPTHFAVAIQYDNRLMDAPTVIAKGQDYTALKIKEVAKEHNIIMMENKPLARALYSQVEIGETIPAELFQAVAEVLAYVYKLQGRNTTA